MIGEKADCADSSVLLSFGPQRKKKTNWFMKVRCFDLINVIYSLYYSRTRRNSAESIVLNGASNATIVMIMPIIVLYIFSFLTACFNGLNSNLRLMAHNLKKKKVSAYAIYSSIQKPPRVKKRSFFMNSAGASELCTIFKLAIVCITRYPFI